MRIFFLLVRTNRLINRLPENNESNRAKVIFVAQDDNYRIINNSFRMAAEVKK